MFQWRLNWTGWTGHQVSQGTLPWTMCIKVTSREVERRGKMMRFENFRLALYAQHTSGLVKSVLRKSAKTFLWILCWLFDWPDIVNFILQVDTESKAWDHLHVWKRLPWMALATITVLVGRVIPHVTSSGLLGTSYGQPVWNGKTGPKCSRCLSSFILEMVARARGVRAWSLQSGERALRCQPCSSGLPECVWGLIWELPLI